MRAYFLTGKCNADVDYEAPDGNTALSLAARYGEDNIVWNLVKKYNAKVRPQDIRISSKRSISFLMN